MSDPLRLGSLLREARERRRLSQQAVAEALGIPRTAVTNIEAGSRLVSTRELTRLADLYGTSPSFFLESGPSAQDLATVWLRAVPELADSPEIEDAVFRILDLCREGATLKRLLGQTREEILPNYANKLRTVIDSIRQGESVAEEERRRMQLGVSPVARIAELIADQGVWTAAAALPPGVSGVFTSHVSIGLAVVVDSSQVLARRRFSYAHEYAHALFDRAETVTTTRRENAADVAEARANAFAAAFLMPAEGVAEELRQLDKGQPSRSTHVVVDSAGENPIDAEQRTRPGSQTIAFQDAATLAHHFGVSYDAMVWRLKNLGYLSGEAAKTLQAQRPMGKRYQELLRLDEDDESAVERSDTERELRSQLTRLVMEAYRQEEISRGRLFDLAKKIGVSGEELFELAEAAREG